MFVIDVPYWLPLGIWTGVVSQFIPTMGTYLGGALPVLFAFGASTVDGIAVIVFIIVYQQIENYLFAPRISKRTMNIHPAVAFGAVVVGGAVGGAMGALIAIPIVASIQSLIETYGRRYELIPEIELHDAGEAPPSDALRKSSSRPKQAPSACVPLTSRTRVGASCLGSRCQSLATLTCRSR